MREIKFRAWNKKEKQMFSWDDLLKHARNFDSFDSLIGHFNNPSTGILMQFTGLLDRFGKEIYEGDILKGTGIDGKIRSWEAVSLIYFHHWQETQDLLEQYEDVEVIGNIYENPKLIK